MHTGGPADPQAQELLSRLMRYCFPDGVEAFRGVRGIRTTQRGAIRSSARAAWMAFTAEEEIDATRSRFCWVARLGRGLLASVTVVDAYGDGRGRLVIKKGPIQIRREVGPAVDKAELQRYLAYVSLCPPMMLGNASLEWTSAGPSMLRVRDLSDPASASVVLEVAEDGRPSIARAERPMTRGTLTVETPWSARGTDDRDYEGLRVPSRLEATWHLPSGSFSYIQMEIESFTLVR